MKYNIAYNIIYKAMSESKTPAVLGAATSIGWLASFLTDWKFALLAALILLIAGLLVIFFIKRRKNQESK